MAAKRGRRIADMLLSGRIVQLPATASVREASKLMAKERIGAIMVTEADRLLGIFTERDALNRVMAQGRDPEETTLAQVMTRNPTSLSPEDASIDALRLMRDGGFRHLPVTLGDTLVGVISLRDFVGAELAAVEEEQQVKLRLAEGLRH